jgi:hypothetical protein
MNLKLKMLEEHQMKNPGMELELNEIELYSEGTAQTRPLKNPRNGEEHCRDGQTVQPRLRGRTEHAGLCLQRQAAGSRHRSVRPVGIRPVTQGGTKKREAASKKTSRRLAFGLSGPDSCFSAGLTSIR